jgi:hypothetical protein
MDLREIVLRRDGLDSAGSVEGPVARHFEHVNEISGSIEGRELLEQLCDYQLLKKDSVLNGFS